MKTRVKPPKETKAELIDAVIEDARDRWPNDPEAAIRYLLNFFTAVDLDLIVKDLSRLAARPRG